MHKITANYMGLSLHKAGGGYATIDNVDDGEGGQKTGGASPGGQSGMSGEMGGGDQAPQNYGFTSVVADGENIGSGKGTGAEALMSYPGGNASFRVAGVMQDRRHRLKGLDKIAKGSVGIHGLKEWGQQFLNTADGMFMTGNLKKKMRFALVENGNQEQDNGGGGASKGVDALTGFGLGVEALTDGGGGGSGGGEGGGGGKEGGKKLGQDSLHNQKSEAFIEQTEKMNEYVNTHHQMRRTSNVAFEVNPDDKCYVAGLKDKHKFSKILTEDGPMPKGMGRID